MHLRGLWQGLSSKINTFRTLSTVPAARAAMHASSTTNNTLLCNRLPRTSTALPGVRLSLVGPRDPPPTTPNLPGPGARVPRPPAPEAEPRAMRAGMFMPAEPDPAQAERDPQEPLHVLICGWKTRQFMSALCRELDRGRTQLPRGSHVTFFNEHPPEALDCVEESVRCA